jgi:chromosome segregation ATPase
VLPTSEHKSSKKRFNTPSDAHGQTKNLLRFVPSTHPDYKPARSMSEKELSDAESELADTLLRQEAIKTKALDARLEDLQAEMVSLKDDFKESVKEIEDRMVQQTACDKAYAELISQLAFLKGQLHESQGRNTELTERFCGEPRSSALLTSRAPFLNHQAAAGLA